MPRLRLNPLGFTLQPSQARGNVIRVGQGLHTHLLNPKTLLPICESAKGRAKQKQTVFRSDAKVVTCYRCSKLAEMNVQAGRAPWEGP